MAAALGSRVFAGPVKDGDGSTLRTREGIHASRRSGSRTLRCCTGTAIRSTCRAVRYGSLPARRMNQAFQHGRNALALQFHMEADRRGLEAVCRPFVELAAAGISVAALRSATTAVADLQGQQARSIFSGGSAGSISRPDCAAATSTGMVAVEAGEQAFQVLDLRQVVDRDIGVARIAGQEILVIGLGREEFPAGLDPGDVDGVVEDYGPGLAGRYRPWPRLPVPGWSGRSPSDTGCRNPDPGDSVRSDQGATEK